MQLWLVALIACTDPVHPPDLVDTGTAPDVVTGVPAASDPPTATLTVSPPALEVADGCAAEGTLWLANDGQAVLTVTATPTAGLAVAPAEIVLGPGDVAPVTVRGPGAGIVQLASEAGSHAVPIDLAASPPPSLEVVAAVHEVVDGPTTLEALVDAPDGARVTWTSDVEGPVGTATVADGWATLTWDPTELGEHRVTATVADACGRRASAEQRLCRDGERVHSGLGGWSTDGDATLDTDELALTHDLPWEVGAAWFDAPVWADHVSVGFSFYATSDGGPLGADGLALVLADPQSWDGTLGPAGGGMGFGAGVEPGDGIPGWAVELDTSFNGVVDPVRGDHAAFVVDGDLATWRASGELANVEDGAWHRVTVAVDAPDVHVSVDGATVFEATVFDDLHFPGVIGFTAATGSYASHHRVADIEVVTRACE